MRGVFRVASVVPMLVLLGACASTDYYRLESQLIQVERPLPDPVVDGSPTYEREIGRLHRVALLPPEWCEELATAAARGTASAAGRIMQNDCAVQMNLIERALTRAGFQVISWDVIDNQVKGQANATPAEAAGKRGAQVLFQINSLERSEVRPGKERRIERHFFESTAADEKGGKALVKQDRAKEFRGLLYAEERRRGWDDYARQAATINASAVLIDSSTAIWFYEWTYPEPFAQVDAVRMLVRCESDVPCARTRPRKKDEKKRSSDRIDGETVTFTTDEAAMNARQVVFNELVEQVVEDMVARFAGIRGAPAAVSAGQ